MNDPRTRRILTFLLPVLSLFVSTSIVAHEYSRKAQYEKQYAAEEREYTELQIRLPQALRSPKSTHNDNHDHAEPGG